MSLIGPASAENDQGRNCLDKWFNGCNVLLKVINLPEKLVIFTTSHYFFQNPKIVCVEFFKTILQNLPQNDQLWPDHEEYRDPAPAPVLLLLHLPPGEQSERHVEEGTKQQGGSVPP